MRTLARYMQYIQLPEGKQTSFLKLVKERTKLPWHQIAHLLDVNKSMVYFYLNEKSKLPYSRFVILSELAKISITENVRLTDIKNKTMNIRLPLLSDALAEFIGAMAGDGHMNRITYEVSISLDKDLDEEYSDHIIYLYRKLFEIKARKYKQNAYHKVKCYTYSKKLVEFLSEVYTAPIGKKKGNLHIPLIIKRNKTLLRAYIRGVFDTDGSYHRHHKNDGVIELISRDPVFLEELRMALNELNFRTSMSEKNLYIYGRKQIERFFEEIKPSNSKHLRKYTYYLRHNRVPLTCEIVKR